LAAIFTTDDLAAMRAAQEAHMMDTCTLTARSQMGVDDFNLPVWTDTETADVPCGLDLRASREIMVETQLPVYDARLRLAHDQKIEEVDRVSITHRFGEALATPLEFEVLGLAMSGPSGQVLNLRTMTKE